MLVAHIKVSQKYESDQDFKKNEDGILVDGEIVDIGQAIDVTVEFLEELPATLW